jgi:hypothetical protein
MAEGALITAALAAINVATISRRVVRFDWRFGMSSSKYSDYVKTPLC